MTAKELRLGNNIHHIERRCIINIIAISDDKINFQYTLDEVRPILLTEEWLIKFGFGNCGKHFSIIAGHYYNVQQQIKNTSLKITHTSADNYRVINFANGSIYLKNVHQLQNLYFALTGKELTIKQ